MWRVVVTIDRFLLTSKLQACFSDLPMKREKTMFRAHTSWKGLMQLTHNTLLPKSYVHKSTLLLGQKCGVYLKYKKIGNNNFGVSTKPLYFFWPNILGQ